MARLLLQVQVIPLKSYCIRIHFFSECAAVLHGEYMSHEGKPLCLRDYNERYGVRCYECQKFIAGRVLQVSDGGD